MDYPNLEQNIHQAALMCGFDNCGIIPLDYLDGFKKRYQERIRKVPSSAVFYKMVGDLTAPRLLPEHILELPDDCLIKNVISKTAGHMQPSDVSVLRRNAERVLRFREKK